MRPENTFYRLTESEEETEKFLSIVRDNEVPVNPITFPVIVAIRDEEVIGGIARHTDSDRILIEPVAAPSMIVYIRLIEAMENLLGAAGCKFFEFRVAVGREEIGFLKRSGAVIDLGVDDTSEYRWFRRYIHGRKQ